MNPTPIYSPENFPGKLCQRNVIFVPLVFILAVLSFSLQGATFTNNASIQVSDPSSSLTSTNGVFTVSCWFRMSIPSSQTLSGNMDILIDRMDGNEGANFSYLIRYNYTNNAIEFLTQGASGVFTPITLIQNPFLERWYHVAISRSGATFNAYVDGRTVPGETVSLGSTAGSGVSIGGIGGNSRQFSGDIIELAIYSSALSPSQIQSRMFEDQRNFANLKGYFKLGYSTNSANFYHNFAASPPSGTDPATPIGSGTIAFNQVDQAGEQSLFDANLNHGQNALTPLSGAFAWSQTALARPVPGIAFDLQFGYSSALPTQPPTDGSLDPYDQRILGDNWRETFDARVVYGPGNDNLEELDVVNWDGSVQAWTRTNLLGSLSTRDHEYKGELTQPAGSYVQWTTPDRLVYLFDDPGDANSVMAGRLEQISDFNGNAVQIQWDENEGLITNVIDSAGGNYHFNYDPGRQLLTNVTFNAWQVNFAYDATNRLISKSITNTSGMYAGINTTWQFGYGANGLLQQIVDPRGNISVLVQYDQYARMTNEIDALGRATRSEYDEPQTWQMRHTDPGGFQWIEMDDTRGHVLSQTDPLGNTTSYSYDTNGNRTSITKPLRWTTYFGYDNRGNVIAGTNAFGLVSQWTMDAFFNKALQSVDPLGLTNFYALNETNGELLSHNDALGTLVNYTYSTNGLVLSSVDANGNATRFSHDTNGFLISKTDPGTNVTRYSYNDVGWKLSETNALNQVTSYSYDLNGNVVKTIDTLNRAYTKRYDANGNLLLASDAKGQLTTYEYDTDNEKIAMTNRAGSAWTYAYNSRGSLLSTTDPLNNTVYRTYDAANRLVAVTDPLGNTVSNIYDADGNVTITIDQLGQSWFKTYDRLDRVVASSDPQGDITATTFDADGRVSEITSPNGYPTTHSYDGRGRLTKWLDTQNFPWLYAYDGVGNITNITDALGGHYIMAYDSRNERIFEENQDSNVWHYAYDQLMRLQQKTDPNGIVRTYSYDAGSRITQVNYSSGREDGFTYDLNDNHIIVSRAGSGPATQNAFSYDSLDRVVSDTDTFGNTVGYGFDPLGRRHTLTYPGGKVLTYYYDVLGRLTNQVDWAGRQMNYTYDQAGRLLTRIYPNSVIQSNAFDNAGRITSLNYSLLNAQPSTNDYINVALSYAYDLNGNKTGSTEQGTLDWPMPSLHNESSTYTPAGKLITLNDALSNTNNFTYHYDASGSMTNAVSSGESYALTYDEDSRVMSIAWSLGALLDETISNRYDIFGRRVSKTTAGIETDYVLDLGGGMERVLCDMNSGVVSAWYVYGPDLCYKVDATNGVTCYHADAMGNIIALTDVNTNLIAEYAYTPYGRNLSSTNYPAQLSNPYMFVGSQGVMEDLPDLYFMRARYYSADASAFLSTDPIKNIGPEWTPIPYVYARNNPLNCQDPTGLLVFLIGGQVAGDLYAALGIQGAASGGIAIDPNQLLQGNLANGLGLYSTQSVGTGIGGGGDVSGAVEFGVDWAANSISDLNGAEAYASAGGGAAGRASGSVGFDSSGNPTSFTLDIGLEAGGDFAVSSGISYTEAVTLGKVASAANTFTQVASSAVTKTSGTMAAAATTAFTAATISNSRQSTAPSPPTFTSGTTSQKTGATHSGGSGAFATTSTVAHEVSNISNQVTQTVQRAVNNASTAVQNAIHTVVQTISNFFSHL